MITIGHLTEKDNVTAYWVDNLLYCINVDYLAEQSLSFVFVISSYENLT